ncbi:Uma2 family endonuclease [Neolewinella agarilytica]|uniref:Endonuclease, Uma2 family (Restriction endonuclease fold) n=1 Tax=Neolewinella agarilytica TaxID=478744 RepID=A0A1H9AUU6_9BACT|nr:Uma2 family endonuclease [Neolewinella agarilytica]SEP80536.1 Endonuclease, Uma2 family (restriction endonuclease fold) [Neolewinella agarilytica]
MTASQVKSLEKTQVSLEIPVTVFPLVVTQEVSNEVFESICFTNPELVIEREPNGKIIIMSPVSFSSGDRELEISADLKFYARKHGGKALSSSTGFTLPDSSVRSPDACYVSEEKLAGFTEDDFKHFLAVVPDFVVEILSPTDSLKTAEAKMRDSWIDNGVKLAWLIDVDNDRLWIYRADRSVELVTPLDHEITGEDILPGFTFDLRLLS